MQQIVNFIVRFRNFLFYLLLLSISLIFTVGSNSYHRSKYFNSANWLSGSVYGMSSGIGSYFKLKSENEKLRRENQQLRQLIINRKDSVSLAPDSLLGKYTVAMAKVVKNSYSNSRNYLTIDKGERDGVGIDMGVISPLGVVGIIEGTSKRYATVQSILNDRSNINAKLKNTNHFGSLVWDGRGHDEVQLVDIPKLAPITIGDTIVTGGMSSIFPDDIPIGVVKTYNFDTSQSFYTIVVDLFNDMTNLNSVYIVKNKDKQEIQQLEAKTENNGH